MRIIKILLLIPFMFAMAVLNAYAYLLLWRIADLPIDWDPGLIEIMAVSGLSGLVRSLMPHRIGDQRDSLDRWTDIATASLMPWFALLFIWILQLIT